jgi:hypothetical protein
MAGWMTYKELKVPDSTIGAGGGYLKDDLEALADRAPYYSTSNPTVNDDSGDGFSPGSQWMNTSTQTLWMCTDASTGAAQWRSLYKRSDDAIVLAPAAGVGGSDHQAVAEGGSTASGPSSHAEGASYSSGSFCHAEGWQCGSTYFAAHSEGKLAVASGKAGHAEGYYSLSSGDYAHAEGRVSNATGVSAHAEGNFVASSGNYSHAEGTHSTASGLASHAEGYDTTASGIYSHAEGAFSIASGFAAHAEGSSSAFGNQSHAEGWVTAANSLATHAGGMFSTASLYGQWARACGGHSDQRGTAQTTITHLFRRTTNATEELTLRGATPSAATRFLIFDGQTLSCFVNVVGRKENGGANDHASFLRQVCIRREGSTTQLVGSVQTVGVDINPASWGGVTITADDTNDALKIEVTGLGSTDIRWMATVMASEVADAAI